MKNNIYILIGALVVFLYLIFSFITGLSIPCAFHEITHLLCPGCGVTRMFKALLEGNIIKAFYYNQLIFISLPIFLVLFIDLVYCNFKNKKCLLLKIPNSVYYVYIVILLVFAVVRNII